MDKKVIIAVVVVVLLAAYFLFPGQQQAKPQTVIKVSGAWALYPLMVKWADEYQKIHSDVKIDIQGGGAGKGMADALSGQVGIGMISREIDKSEIAKGAYPVAVAKDAVIPAANKKNPIASELAAKGMNRSQFIKVFISGEQTTWGELVGKPEAANKVISYTRSDSCGAGDVWAMFLGVKQEDLKGVGVNGDPGMAEAVSNDPNGIGYNNLGFAYDPNTGEPSGNLMMIPIDLNDNGVIDANESFYEKKSDMIAAIADGRYPSPPSRQLYIVTLNKPVGPTADFVRWILSDGQKFVVETGFIPLKEDLLNREQAGLQ